MPQTVVFQSIGAEDGNIIESTETSNAGGVATAGSDDLQVGDHLADRQARGILSFDTSSLPDQAIVTAATVRVRRIGLWGGNPFDTLGACLVDVQRGTFGSVALQAGDFEAAATAPAAGTLGNAAATGDWSSGTLSAAGMAAIDPTGRTQVRIAFSLDDNDNNLVDRLRYAAGEHPDAASRPELIVTFVQ